VFFLIFLKYRLSYLNLFVILNLLVFARSIKFLFQIQESFSLINASILHIYSYFQYINLQYMQCFLFRTIKLKIIGSTSILAIVL